MTLGPADILLLLRETVLALGKYDWFGVLIGAGEAGPRVMASKVLVGMFEVLPPVTERERSRFRGRSIGAPLVGGRGAGPGFMNWFV